LPVTEFEPLFEVFEAQQGVVSERIGPVVADTTEL
jgi:hypothetical protein